MQNFSILNYIMTFAFLPALLTAAADSPTTRIPVSWAFLSALLTVVAAVIAASLMNGLLGNVIDRAPLDKALKAFLKSAAKAVVWFIALIIAASKLGFDVTSLVAVLSLAGLAFSLSIQGLLNNFFAGVTLLVTKPFLAGDLAEVCGQNGIIRQIGLTYTQIVTPDNRLIYLNNGDVVKAPVINYSREGRRQIEFKFTLPKATEVSDVRSTVGRALSADARVFAEPAPFTAIASNKGGQVEYLLRFWSAPADYDAVRFWAAEELIRAFDEQGCDINF